MKGQKYSDFAVINSPPPPPTDVEEMGRKESDGRVTQISCPEIVKAYTAKMGRVDKADTLKTLCN
jgi:hypothetical protein